jgi:glycosyltransferase involved in cell wall biosynthesis
MPTPSITVIIPTFNPSAELLFQVLEALKGQSLSPDAWELIIVDNASTNQVLDTISLGWHPNAVIVQEPRQGLTYARICGFSKAQSSILILVDDDNVLDSHYLEWALQIFTGNATLGAAGGKVLPYFITPPPVWINEVFRLLSLRDFGEQAIISNPAEPITAFPYFAPIGGGMAIRKESLTGYLKKVNSNECIELVADRKGEQLSSCGDNDIILHIMESHWSVGYFPQLSLTHIIPAKRLSLHYLSRLSYESSRSWVQVLQAHNISPWERISKSTVLLRKWKAYFFVKAWKKEANYLRWREICGIFDETAQPAKKQSLVRISNTHEHSY